VSHPIPRLERARRLRLFERTSREVQLTHAGKLLLPYAEALLDNASGLSAEAARLAIPASGAIRLAYCPMVGTLAARVTRRLASRSPAARPGSRSSCGRPAGARQPPTWSRGSRRPPS
jgi:DNA-binding transcriptional LysR family regulator